jgi:hypothetical protein
MYIQTAFFATVYRATVHCHFFYICTINVQELVERIFFHSIIIHKKIQHRTFSNSVRAGNHKNGRKIWRQVRRISTTCYSSFHTRARI